MFCVHTMDCFTSLRRLDCNAGHDAGTTRLQALKTGLQTLAPLTVVLHVSPIYTHRFKLQVLFYERVLVMYLRL